MRLSTECGSCRDGEDGASRCCSPTNTGSAGVHAHSTAAILGKGLIRTRGCCGPPQSCVVSAGDARFPGRVPERAPSGRNRTTRMAHTGCRPACFDQCLWGKGTGCGGSQPTLSAALATCGVKPVARRRSALCHPCYACKPARLNDFSNPAPWVLSLPRLVLRRLMGYPCEDAAPTRLGSAPVQETGA